MDRLSLERENEIREELLAEIEMIRSYYRDALRDCADLIKENAEIHKRVVQLRKGFEVLLLSEFMDGIMARGWANSVLDADDKIRDENKNTKEITEEFIKILADFYKALNDRR